MRILKLHQDTIAYNSAITACGRGRLWRKALEMLGNMVEGRVPTSIATCNAVMSACEKSGEWQRALDILRFMVASSVEVDSISLSTAVAACEGQLELGQGEDLIAFLSDADVSCGPWSAAVWLLDRRLALHAGLSDAKGGARQRLRRIPLAPRMFLLHLASLGASGLALRRCLRACSRPKRVSFRFNPIKAPRDLLKQLLGAGWRVTSIPWSPDGFFVDVSTVVGAPLGAMRLRSNGQIYLQESSSMVPAEVLRRAVCMLRERDPKLFRDGHSLRVLDACSAPGSKSTQLGLWLQAEYGGGLLVANELDKRRAASLRANVISAGLTNTMVTCVDGQVLGSLAPGQFDAVLADVPCSCEGNSRKNAVSLLGVQLDGVSSNTKAPAAIEPLVELQARILRSAWQALRSGGCLVYSTCTFNRWENEAQCERLMGEFKAKALDVPSLLGMPAELAGEFGSLRMWPHTFDIEGFFVACFIKDADSVAAQLGHAAHLERWSGFAQLRSLTLAELNSLRDQARRQLGFWLSDGGMTDDANLRAGTDGEVWLLPSLGDGLDSLAEHCWEPGIPIARAQRSGGGTDGEGPTVFKLSKELLLFAGDRASGPLAALMTEDQWESLYINVKEANPVRGMH